MKVDFKDDSVNPYEPKSLVDDASVSNRISRPRWFVFTLIVSACVLAIPPLPLFFWVADGEPFFGPAATEDLTLVAFSGTVSVLWLVWSTLLIYGVLRQWLSSGNLWWLVLSCIGAGISILVVYLYGYDQRWFR